MKRVIWSSGALADARRNLAYLAAENPSAALRLAALLEAGAEGLAVLPDRGRLGLVPGTRELVTVPPYVIVYQVQDDAVVILRVWHAAQDR